MWFKQVEVGHDLTYSAKLWWEKLWQITLDLPNVSFSVKYVALNLKTTIDYFIITCNAKMVHTFVVLSLVRGYHKDVWDASIDGTELPCEREPHNPRDISAVAVKSDW